ncbi:sugar phosphate nucleotidyltransferase [Roseicyclus sp. F158]|uniref:Sugar phosphate nucleotidyltransferase n=1 Tax=Tropicimonas omnivorans TaxID=3075590 RepID=A0ABU3DFZ9_9RHOB|nr:sugar phosphate nucleotidyltransferase [Roseicyclus sp. F158]MDT0682484.1 sugar phosphate nucleotidyltransferase [Roseicyclus sp. F158]
MLLAGGRGTRLHELTDDECKPALWFAGRHRICDFAMANVVKAGIGRMIVATQYRPATLTEHMATRWSRAFTGPGRGLEIRDGASVGAAGYAGTADAVTRNIDVIDRAAPKHVLVLAADHVYEIDYGAMLAQHAASGAPVTVAMDVVPRKAASGFGVADTDASGRVIRFLEKPSDPPGLPDDPTHSLASMGIYIFTWSWLRERLIADAEDRNSSHDFGHDILPTAVAEGGVQSYRLTATGNRKTAYWRDVGTLDAYRAAQMDFVRGTTPCDLPLSGRVETGRDRIERIGGAAQVHRALAGFGEGLTGSIEDSVVLPGAFVSPLARIRRTIVASGTRIPSGVTIGEDPAEDATWFRRTPGGTVLVTAAMLARRESERRSLHPVAAHRARSVDAGLRRI